MNRIAKWWANKAPDKKKHLQWVMMIQPLNCYTFGLVRGTLVTVGIFVGKEILDKLKGGKFDMKDIYADVYGLVLGTFLFSLSKVVQGWVK
jgi:hypothetical protein